jgi:hypothetical protein
MSRKEGSGLAPKRSKKRKRKDGKLYPPTPSRIKPQEVKSFSPMPSPNAIVDSKNVIQSDEHSRNNVCDMYEGSWVFDDSYPLYKPGSCPHIDEPFNCFLNGRKDNKYEKFRWQPKNCNMPRYFLMISCRSFFSHFQSHFGNILKKTQFNDVRKHISKQKHSFFPYESILPGHMCFDYVILR